MGNNLKEIVLKNNYMKGPAGAILATSASESHFLIPPLLSHRQLKYTNFSLIYPHMIDGTLKLTPFEGLTELPTSIRHVEACHSPTVTGGDLEGQALTVEVRVALPVLSPVP